jgi:hypothetical protein
LYTTFEPYFIFTHIYPFISTSPLPLTFSSALPLPPRTCSALLFSEFVEEKRKKMIFLLVLDKDSYARSFLVVFPCIYVL